MAKIFYDRQVVLDWFKDNGLIADPNELHFAKHLGRNWRFDFTFSRHGKVALECEGGIFSRGRHSNPAGMVKDIEKYNTAAALGWSLIRCTPADLCMTETVDFIKGAIAARETR
jgi:hypothetical protein